MRSRYNYRPHPATAPTSVLPTGVGHLSTQEFVMHLHPAAEVTGVVEAVPTMEEVRAERMASDRESLAMPRTPDEAAVVATDAVVGGVPVRWYRSPTPSSADAGVLVYLHGGGWVFGSIETLDVACRRLALQSGVSVLSVGYRLVPEHPWPSPLEDVDAVLAALAGGEVAPTGSPAPAGSAVPDGPPAVVVAGDSAGGWLALVAARRARDAARPVAGQALVYPVVTRGALDGRDPDEGGATDFTVREMQWYWDMLLGSDTTAVPAAAADAEVGWPDDLAGMPPSLVLLAEHDILLPEGHALADALQAAGVDVVASIGLGLHHGYFRHPDVFSASGTAIDQVASWARDRLAALSGRDD